MVGLIWFFFEKRTIFNPTIKFRAAIKATIKTPGKVFESNEPGAYTIWKPLFEATLFEIMLFEIMLFGYHTIRTHAIWNHAIWNHAI